MLVIFSSYGQWIENDINSNEEFFSIGSYNSNLVFGGMLNSLAKSENGGLTWQTYAVLDEFNNNIIISGIYDVEFVSPNQAFMVGFSHLGNDYIIYESVNGGQNWAIKYANNNGTYPRTLRALDFINNNIGISVGTNGLILRTTNGGQNWNVVFSGTTKNLKDVFFINQLEGYIVGEEIILKTIDGGISWTTSNFPGTTLNSVFFPSTNIGYAVGNEQVIMKTWDGGVTWDNIEFNANQFGDFNEIYCLDDDLLFVTIMNRLYRSTNGGVHWEYFETNSGLNPIHFTSNQNGFIGANSGFVYTTNNQGEVYTPVSYFEFETSIFCSDSIVYVNSLSDNDLTHSWYVNDVFYSNNVNFQYAPSSEGDFDEVKLVVSNGVFSDTMIQLIYIESSLNIEINASILQDTICEGDHIDILINNSALDTYYSIINQQGDPTSLEGSGNGGNLFFNNIGPLFSSSYLIVRAEIEILGCGNSIVDSMVFINYDNPNYFISHYLEADTICREQSTQYIIPMPENNVTYSLFEAGNFIAQSQSNGNDTIYFQTNTISESTDYWLVGISDFGCSTYFPTQSLIVEHPLIYVSMSNYNPEVNEPIETINNSINPLGTYEWAFGSQATPSFSQSQMVSGLMFSEPGKHDVTLVATGNYGCTDTIIQVVNVIPNHNIVYPESVNHEYSNIFADGFSAIALDQSENIYSLSVIQTSDSLMAFSGLGDTLKSNKPYVQFTENSRVLVKHNASGVPMWATHIISKPTGKAEDVIVDEDGNVLVVFYHNAFNEIIKVYSTDGRDTTFTPPHSTSSQQSLVLVKYSRNGEYIWHNCMLDFYTIGSSSIKINNNSDIFVSGHNTLAKLNNSGDVLWSINIPNIGDIVPDETGGVHVLHNSITHYNSDGELDFIAPPLNILSGTIGQIYLVKDSTGNFYSLGTFRGEIVIGMDTLVDIYTFGPSHQDFLLIKWNSLGQPIWANQLKVDRAVTPLGFDIFNDEITLLGRTSSDSLVLIGDTTIYLSGNSSLFAYRCDYTGLNSGANMFYESSANTIGNLRSRNCVKYSLDGSRLYYAFPYRDDFQTPDGVGLTHNPIYQTSHAITNHYIDTLLHLNMAENALLAYFEQDKYGGCEGEEFNFQDLSTGNPTSWFWEFEGGMPSTSNSQNPNVIYDNEGTYLVSLMVTDGDDTSYYSSYVSISIRPTIEFSSSNFYCSNSSSALNLSISQFSSSNFESLFWFNGSTTNWGGGVFPSSDTSYYLLASNGFCVDTSIHEVTYVLPPVFEYSPEFEDTVCFQDGDFALPSVTPLGGNWYANPFIISNGYLTIDNTLQNQEIEVIYSWFEPASFCLFRDTSFIFIDYCTPISFFNIPPVVCSGDSIQFFDQSSFDPILWEWDFQGGVSGDNNLPNPFVVFPDFGEYEVTLVASNAGGEGTTYSQMVVVHETPSLNFIENVSSCDWFILDEPSVGNYFTEPFGGGSLLLAGDTINSTSTLFVFAENDYCMNDSSFNIAIFSSPSPAFEIQGNTLIAQENDASYFWYDCDDLNTVLGTDSSFTPSITGSYMLVVSLDECESASDCFDVDYTGLENVTIENIVIYPNPTSSKVYIFSDKIIDEFSLMDSNGSQILNGRPSVSQLMLELSEFASGIYYLRINNMFYKVVKN